MANLTLSTSGSHQTLIGGSGNDSLSSSGFFNTLIAGSGTDTLSSSGAFDTLIGGSGNDALASSGFFNMLIAGSGTDVLSSSGTDDTLIAGSGADMLSSSGSHCALIGGSGTDTLASNGGSDQTLIAGSGADVLTSIGFFDTLVGNARGSLLEQTNPWSRDIAGYALSNVTVNLSTGTAAINGSSVSDSLIGFTAVAAYGDNDTLIAGTGPTTLASEAGGGDTLIGGTGPTSLISDAGGNLLIAGTGPTIAEYDGTGVAVDLTAGTATVSGSGVSDRLVGISVVVAAGSFETLIGGTGLTTLDSTVNGNTLIAGSGTTVAEYDGDDVSVDLATGTASAAPTNDFYGDTPAVALPDTLVDITVVSAGGSNSTLIAGSAADTLYSTGFENTLIGNANGSLLQQSSAGDDDIAGYSLNDVTVDLATGTASLNGSGVSDRLAGFTAVEAYGKEDTLIAGSGITTLISDAGGNTLIGGNGPTVAEYVDTGVTVDLATATAAFNGSSVTDSLVGITVAAAGGSNETLMGGTGLSTLIGNAGGNTLIAGSGITVAEYDGSGDIVDLATGMASSADGTTVDSLVGMSVVASDGDGNTLIGGSGGDTLSSSGQFNTLIAGSGANVLSTSGFGDELIATSGSDTLSSSGGFNALIAGSGVDVLSSSGSFDALSAGSGTDTLLANGAFTSLSAGSGSSTLAGTGFLDVYQFALGDGQATIVNGSVSATPASNELDFGTGITDQNLWFAQSGNDLRIDLIGTQSQVTVSNWFASSGSQLSEITAGGLKLDSQVSQLVQAMAAFSADHPGFNPTAATATQAPSDPALQSAIAVAWHG